MDREALRAVWQMQDYIERHLSEPITLNALAREAGYSPWYAARLFKEGTGKSPFAYIRALRLTNAALCLRDGTDKVVDVALDFLFDSHEGFTRAFTRQFGVAPKRYSLKPPPISLFIPYKAWDASIEARNANERERESMKTIFVQVMERPARKVLLKRGLRAEEYFAYCGEVGCDVWGVLCSVKEALYEPIGMWLPDHLIAPGTSRYVQGVELPLTYDSGVPEGFELIELPPCQMMVFQSESYDDAQMSEVIGEVWEHIEHFDPSLYGYAWAPEMAPRFQLAPMGCRGYIEARPVQPLDIQR